MAETVSSGCWLLWFRADLDPAEVDAHWEAWHGDIVAAVPGTREYRQHHFSRDDHGFSPAPAGWTPGVAHDDPPHRRYSAGIKVIRQAFGGTSTT